MKLGKKLLAVVLAAVLALAMLTACGGDSSAVPVEKEKMQQVVDNINAVRVKNGLPELEVNAAAEEIADQKATLYDKYQRKAITESQYKEQNNTLDNILVDGKRYSGYVATRSIKSAETFMTEEYWQKKYDEGELYHSSTRIVTDPNTTYIGVSIKKAVDGRFVAVVLTY